MSHRIRLGPPWEVVQEPDGRMRHVRRFGRPRTVDPGERVWMVAELPAGAEVRLNGEPITLAADVTEQLQPRNELVVIAAAAPENVALEIVAAPSG
jgi:hypothetical protein